MTLGSGRHRLWFETKDQDHCDPLLEHVFSHCGAPLTPARGHEAEVPMRFLLSME